MLYHIISATGQVDGLSFRIHRTVGLPGSWTSGSWTSGQLDYPAVGIPGSWASPVVVGFADDPFDDVTANSKAHLLYGCDNRYVDEELGRTNYSYTLSL
jgi:hypothetical protein